MIRYRENERGLTNPFTHTLGLTGKAEIATYKEEEVYRNFFYEVINEKLYS